MEYEWVEPTASVSDELGATYHQALARALERRGVTDVKEASVFLDPQYDRDCHDPFLFEDMYQAVARIGQSLASDEHIVLYCDYDVDGLSSGSVLYTTLTQLGGTVTAYMNHREKDGYGLQRKALSTLIDNGAQLIITTDCGISNASEIAYAVSRGVDVIITDHHTVPVNADDLPQAVAIIHPRVRADSYPCKDLAGGGSAFKLAQALIRTDHHMIVNKRNAARDASGNAVNWNGFEKWLLDYVCLSTVGDCVPLKGENRLFVKYGLHVLAKTKRPGLQALMRRLRMRNFTLNSKAISFFIAPRINAASRMDHGRLAFDLLTADSADEGERIADILENLNTSRQKLTEKIITSARNQLDECHAEQKKVLVGFGEEWPLGILGLVAGKLCDFYRKPVVLMTGGGGTISGAARSTAHFHITEAFARINHFFERYGGHQAAGGFALKKHSSAKDVQKSLEDLGEQLLPDDVHSQKTLVIDGDIELKDCNWDFLKIVSGFEPHGMANPKLLFRIRNAVLERLTPVGQGGKHVRITLSQKGIRKECIAFSLFQKSSQYRIGDCLDVLCELEEHEWMGSKSVQISLIDLQRSALI